MDTIGIAVESWAAWAPGIETHGDWLRWAQGQLQPQQDGAPSVKFFPPMYRRRLSRLGKMAVYVANECAVTEGGSVRVVFASRYGEYRRTEDILNTITAGEAVSPTAFSLSVHNAIAGLYSIVAKDTSPTVSVAAGKDTFASAWIEAVGLLGSHRSQCQEVLLVYYDEALQGDYEAFADESTFPMALALRLRIAQPEDASSIKIARVASGQGNPPKLALSQPLAFLQFLIGQFEQSEGTGYGNRWVWTRNEVA